MATATIRENENVHTCSVCLDSLTDLQPEHVLQELMAADNREMTVADTKCSPCQQRGETTPGTFLCTKCRAVVSQKCAKSRNAETSSGSDDLCDIKDKEEEDKEMGGVNISSERSSQQTQNITEVLDSLHLGEVITLDPVWNPRTSPEVGESLDTRIEEDDIRTVIRDVKVLEVGGIHTVLVTDNNNQCVKSFYTRSNTMCHSSLKLGSSPWGITQLGDDKVMVVVPNRRQFVKVKVTPDVIFEANINTIKLYDNLAVVSSSRLAAVGSDSVDILNMQGEVMNSITTYNNMKLFKCPRFICVNNTGHLLVSDWWKGTVTCLTSEGEVVWIYSGGEERTLHSPEGITTTAGGDILVADSNLKKVVELSKSGEYIRDVVTSQDGLMYPQGICVDKHGSLFICDSGKILKFVLTSK